MRLYHFTSGENLRAIANHGLTVGDVPTDINAFTGLVGVWFTTSDNADGHGLEGGPQNKKAFRLTCEIPDNALALVKWTDWSIKGCTSETRAMFLSMNEAMYDTWYVLFGQALPEHIVSVDNVQTGERVPDWRTMWPQALSNTGTPYWRRHAWHKKMLKACKQHCYEMQRRAA